MRRQAFHCVRGAFAIAVRSRSEQPPPDELPLQPLKSVNAAPSLGRTMLAEAPHPLEEPPTSLQSASPTDIAVEPKIDIVGAFLEEVKGQVEAKQYQENQSIPFPERPETLVPEFRRIKKHQRIVVVIPDPLNEVHARIDNFVQLPPPKPHRWAMQQPTGPHIVHGDGLQNIVGSGEVGFENRNTHLPLPATFRGLQYHNNVGRRLPTSNGMTSQDVVIKHSFKLSGRGLFATKMIPKGSPIMIVSSSAQRTGLEGEINRLGEMVAAFLNTILKSCTQDDMDYLHDFVLTGQLSSLVERWPEAATDRVIEAIGGEENLHRLELHRVHIARIAAVMDMNGFLLESSYAERHGTAYWPEAGLLNHSCAPNCSYDVVPEHMFTESEYYLDMVKHEQQAGDAGTGSSISPSSSARLERLGAEAGLPRDEKSREVEMQPQAVRAYNEAVKHRQTAWKEADLTHEGTQNQLFCCKADRDIAVGEELFISYVPTKWAFEARQIALNHRYKFWCRCEKCSPSIDHQYAKVPKLMVSIVVIVVILQFIAHMARGAQMRSDEDVRYDDEGHMPDANTLGVSGAKRRAQDGYFEYAARKQLDPVHSIDGGDNSIFIRGIVGHDQYSKSATLKINE